MPDHEKPMRYHEGGNVHLDFHGATNTTIDYIIAQFGVEVMDEIFAKVGREVYADLRQHLLADDPSEIARHWEHFFGRENADFSIEATDDEIVLTVRHCTAYHHVQKLTGAVSPHFCDQTIKTNNAMAAGTPFCIDTEITGPGACRQVIRRRS
ncbi:hypothetical protein PSQ90_01665 [Devosia rhodophyticola]|uniref:4-vinyl reductase 4VR domain-containing protein n=1 Tax=Devosia rhodophyticola TaxID=3026423 RepID=A0ABY7YYP1_9HYPH|nr:hypothetical protein [Devosia rhodophyticola]WDR06193.1 hypothetical protein PSQ90_01665 [Devosia rhodophyticola]